MTRDPLDHKSVIIGAGCLWLVAAALSLTLTVSAIVLIWKVIVS